MYVNVKWLTCIGVLFIGIALLGLKYHHDSQDINYSSLRRSLRHNKHESLNPIFLGTSSVVTNITVYGAMISSDFEVLNGRNAVIDVNATKSITELRIEHSREMIRSLPFSVVEWPAIFTRPCPQNKHGHKTERGVGLAHFQIWLDFIFFDHDVLDEMKKGIKGSDLYSSTSWSSTSGLYQASANGSLYKNGVPFLEEDILVVFEDDADIAIQDVNSTMIEELSDMSTDLLFLGWCEGRLARPVPLCAHAYAVTRRGARALVQHYEPCGLAIDEQLVVICKNKWLSFRTAHPYSYKNRYNSNYPKQGDKNFGIFHQKKLGSLNGH